MVGNVNLEGNQGQTSGRKVINVHKVSYQWDEEPLISNFSTTIWRGDKLGIVGLNGSGKSTLLQIIAGTLQASKGQFFANGNQIGNRIGMMFFLKVV